MICIFTYNFTLGQLLIAACANQPPGLSVSETSSPNWFFQAINELKRLMDYPKRLH